MAVDMGPTEAVEHEWQIAANFETEGTVMSIWGNLNNQSWSNSQVWSVGGQPDEGRIWVRNSEQESADLDLSSVGEWQEVEVPDGPLLNWVHGSQGHLWVVGNDGRALRWVDAQVGGRGEWETFDTDTDQDLWGVYVVSPNEVWAVGGDPLSIEDPDPVITRFDGMLWQRVTVPELDRTGVRALFKVYADEQTGHVFAVGMKGVILGDIGQGWIQLPVISNNDNPPSVEDFVSLWGTGDQLIAVGGRSNGVIARWNGQEWRSEMLTGIPGLNGVWVDHSSKATAVGTRGSAMVLLPGSFEVNRERTGTPLVLHATWGTAGAVWAVGGSLDGSPPWEGIILFSRH